MSSATRTLRRVAIYRTELLPLSETFIRQQVISLRQWEPILVGQRLVKGGLSLDGLHVRLTDPKVRRLGGAVDRLRAMADLLDARLIQALKDLRVELVHAHFGTDATDIWPSVKHAGLPMLVTLHGYDINIHREWWEAGHGGIHRRTYPRRLLKMAEDPDVGFIAVSNAIKRRAIEYGIAGDKISVAHIGVDTMRFRPGGKPLEQRSNRILFVGRMVEKKAPLQMVRAYFEVRRRVPDAELIMVGDGPLLANAKVLSSELGVPVIFRGAISPAEVLSEMHLAKALCLPSVTAGNGDAEGFGLVLLEAQACGVPVVSSALGGSTEGLLDGITGHACREDSIEDIVEALHDLLSDDGATPFRSAEAVRLVRERFDLRSCTAELERLFNLHTLEMRQV